VQLKNQNNNILSLEYIGDEETEIPV